MSQCNKPVLVTGATGYVGGRLVPKLLENGHRVRAMGRSLSKLGARSWAGHPLCELVEGDVMDRLSLARAVKGCWAAYYLVHSMNPSTKDFAAADRKGAENMVITAAATGLDRIIYLSGLVPRDEPLSHHLASRAEVARILESGPVPATILRAAMIMGSGSASFEILRYLADRLPLMVAPKWVRSKSQPISIRNVLNYLAACLEHDELKGQTFDICGPDIITYEELFQIYAQEAGLPRRRILPIPVLTPKLSSYWIHLVTPVHASLARPLAAGLRNTVVCTENRIRYIVPQKLMDCRSTIRRILEKRNRQIVETCWHDAGVLVPPEWAQAGDASYAGGAVIQQGFRVELQAGPQELWKPVVRIGGDKGWYFANPMWRLRGWLNKVFGGASTARGRRHPEKLQVGDALDFWRVLEMRPGRRLILFAEMISPGEAILEFKIDETGQGTSELQMIGRFLPLGLMGLVYWYLLLPFHVWIYKGVLKAIANEIQRPIIKGPESFKPAMLNVCKD
jgi:uncharacterized protein YbjT (DUF2867 family)